MANARLETAGAGSPSGFLIISIVLSLMDGGDDLPRDETQDGSDKEDSTETTKDIRYPPSVSVRV